jgi:hypothetical protein
VVVVVVDVVLEVFVVVLLVIVDVVVEVFEVLVVNVEVDVLPV